MRSEDPNGHIANATAALLVTAPVLLLLLYPGRAVSPWLIGASVLTGFTWARALCASLVSIPEALAVSQPRVFRRMRAPASIRSHPSDRNGKYERDRP